MKVNASQLAYLLASRKGQKLSVKQAKEMIERVSTDGEEWVEAADFEKLFPHLPIVVAMESIQKDYLKPGATRSYIMNLPLDLMKNSDKVLKVIRIPGVLRSLLTRQQAEGILTEWRTRYKNHNVEFA